MKPYYEDDWVVIYHGDSRVVASSVDADVLVTDPPYGVALGGTAGAGGKHGLVRGAYATYDDTYENYVETIIPVIEDILPGVQRGAVFSGPHLQELPKASAIGGIYCPAGSGRHPWGFKTFLPLMFYGTAPNLHKGARPNVIQSSATAEANGHPCPKPLSWMRWVVELVSLPDHLKLTHWRRPLKSGGIEFHFQAGGEKMTGSVAPAREADVLQTVCERAWGVTLPEPEWKPSR